MLVAPIHGQGIPASVGPRGKVSIFTHDLPKGWRVELEVGMKIAAFPHGPGAQSEFSAKIRGAGVAPGSAGVGVPFPAPSGLVVPTIAESPNPERWAYHEDGTPEPNGAPRHTLAVTLDRNPSLPQGTKAEVSLPVEYRLLDDQGTLIRSGSTTLYSRSSNLMDGSIALHISYRGQHADGRHRIAVGTLGPLESPKEGAKPGLQPDGMLILKRN